MFTELEAPFETRTDNVSVLFYQKRPVSDMLNKASYLYLKHGLKLSENNNNKKQKVLQ